MEEWDKSLIIDTNAQQGKKHLWRKRIGGCFGLKPFLRPRVRGEGSKRYEKVERTN